MANDRLAGRATPSRGDALRRGQGNRPRLGRAGTRGACLGARIIAAGLAQGANAEACARGLLPGPSVADDLLVTMLSRWLADPTLLTVTLARATYPQVSKLVRDMQTETRPQTVDLARPAECSRIPRFGQATMRSYNPRASLLEIRTPLRRMSAIEALGAAMDPLGLRDHWGQRSASRLARSRSNEAAIGKWSRSAESDGPRRLRGPGTGVRS